MFKLSPSIVVVALCAFASVARAAPSGTTHQGARRQLPDPFAPAAAGLNLGSGIVSVVGAGLALGTAIPNAGSAEEDDEGSNSSTVSSNCG